MALTAAQAHKRIASRLLGKNAGTSTVERLDEAIEGWRDSETVDLEISFNEAAGAMAISTAQLEALLSKHPPGDMDPPDPQGPLFVTKGAKKRTTTLRRLLKWADTTRPDWVPLLERGVSPDTLLSEPLPFLVAKGPGAKQFFLEPLAGFGAITPEQLDQLKRLAGEVGLKIRVCTLATALQQPWRDFSIKSVWAKAFDTLARGEVDRLQAKADALRATQAAVRQVVLDEALPEVPKRPADRI